jgi:hypothetical protein
MIKYIIGFVVACVLWIFVLSQVDMPEYKVYDCSIAEWHPDIPLEVKQQCRELKHQEWKKENKVKVQTNRKLNDI